VSDGKMTTADEFRSGDTALDDTIAPHIRRGSIPPADARRRALWAKSAAWTKSGYWRDPYQPDPHVRAAAKVLASDRWWIRTKDTGFDANPNADEHDEDYGRWWDGDAFKSSGTTVRRKRSRTGT